MAIRNIKILKELKINKDLKIDAKAEQEIMEINNAVNNLREELTNIINQLKSNTDYLHKLSVDMLDNIKVNNESSKSIYESVNQVSESNQVTAIQLQTVTKRLSELTDDIAEIMKNVGRVKQQSQQTRQIGIEGIERIKNLLLQFKKSKDSIENMKLNMSYLIDQSNNIAKITKVIGEITQQVNLLSLNAAIEAARAGEAGKGFSVVADEIKKLSEQTTMATDQINNIIKTLQAEINKVVGNVDEIRNQTDYVYNTMDSTSESINNIKTNIETVDTEINKLEDYIKKVNEYKNSVLVAMEEISAITEQNSAATQEITAVTNEQMNKTGELVEKIEKIEEIVTEQQNIVNKFK